MFLGTLASKYSNNFQQEVALRGQGAVSFNIMSQTCQAVAELSKRRIRLSKRRLHQTIERRLLKVAGGGVEFIVNLIPNLLGLKC